MSPEMIVIIICVSLLIIANILGWLLLMPWIVNRKISGFQNDLVNKYYDEVEVMYRKMRSWRHDYHNHIQVLKANMSLQQYAQADEYLKQDCASAVRSVNALNLPLNQNQFDALVSFTYNCGAGSLKSLCNNRTIEEIGEKIVLYNKAGGKVLNGLVRRRNEEQALYKSGGTCVNPYKEPTRAIIKGCKGDDVKWVQWHLNRYGYGLNVDGDCGPKTVEAITAFQKRVGIMVECCENTIKYLKK